MAEESAGGAKAGPLGRISLTQEISHGLRKRIDAGDSVAVTVEQSGRTPSGGLTHPPLKAFPPSVSGLALCSGNAQEA